MVKFRQNDDPGGLQLTPAPTASDAELYFQDAHPLVTLNNIAATITDFDLIDAGTADAKLTAYTDNLVKSACIEVVNDWFALKSDFGTVHSIQDRNQLFMGSGRDFELDQKLSKLVGLELRLRRSRGLQHKISAVGLQLDADQSVTVKLFSRQKKDPVETQAISATEKNFVWQSVNWSLKSEDGPFYIVYHQDDLGAASSINSVYSYNYGENIAIFPAGKFYAPKAFRADVADSSELWSASLNRYTLSTNYGLNLRFDTRCDYTDFLVEQKLLFKDVIYLAGAIKVLELLANKPAARNARNVVNIDRDYVTYLINGDGRSNRGLVGKYKERLMTISLNNVALDRDCLTCEKRGIIYSTT